MCFRTAGLRVFQGTNLLLEVKRWIERVHPRIWKRRGGRDHIWLLNHDEGGTSRFVALSWSSPSNLYATAMSVKAMAVAIVVECTAPHKGGATTSTSRMCVGWGRAKFYNR